MPFGSEQWMYASGGFYPYEIDQSLRFNNGDSAYLSRTPASAGNRKTFTFSFWAKPVSSTYDPFFGSRGSPTVTRFEIGFYLGQIFIQNNNGSSWNLDIKSSALFRDFSAWYHIVLVFDTTQATASDRVKLYVNGVDQSLAITTSPSLNLNLDCMTTTATSYVGHDGGGAQYYFGYMSDYYFIDGQALDATSFGEFKSGVWIPKSYSGSYGTNGFYLDFGNSGSLGADSSGNSNNWALNNLAATDQVLDSPTNNFATLNSLAASGTFSEGNLKFIGPSNWTGAPSTVKIPNEGKWYAEFLQQTSGQNNTLNAAYGTVGLSSLYSGDPSFTSFQNNSYIFTDTSNVVDFGSSTVKSLGSGGDVIGVSIDMLTGSASIFRNGTLLDSTTISDTTDLNFVYIDYNANYGQFIANFGQDSSFAGNKTAQGNTDANGIGDFYYAPPSGYLALCTANLPDPVIDPAQDDVPADYFNTVLYTGNGSTQSITGVGFQPDFVWFKARSSAYDHQAVDAIRGAGNVLHTNLTSSEGTLNTVSSFDSDGFTVDGTTYAGTNGNGTTFVAWNWLAGNGTSSNTDGTITSTVSANTDAGFSIVTFTTDGSNTTVGTGLSSSAPLDMVVIKRRDSTSEWQVGHRFSGQGSNFAYHLELNSTSALSGAGPYFMGTHSASNGDRIYLASGAYGVSSATWVAYCFQSVEGFSKFGSYTGNGSADGPFVYTGFRPAFLLIKNASTAGPYWNIFDSAREPFNVSDSLLFPNVSSAESTNSLYSKDITSNGFKIRNTNNDHNTNGDTYIYMAFAEMPFKYSNAR